MKKIGSRCEFAQERNAELQKAFRNALTVCDLNNLNELYRLTSESPAPRFYVSERRASQVMSLIDRGADLSGMTPQRRRMFLDLHKLYLRYRRTHPGCSIYDAAFAAVNSRASSFYLTPESCRSILSRIRHGRA